MARAHKILLVGANRPINKLIESSIKAQPEWQHSFILNLSSIHEALNELSISSFLAGIVDCSSMDTSPLEILIQLRHINREMPIILINSPGREKTAIHCLKHGADYYLLKDGQWDEQIPHVLEQVLEEYRQRHQLHKKIHQLNHENTRLKKQSAIDEHTCFYTADHFNVLLSRELRRASRYDLALACLVLDIDSASNPIKEKESDTNHYLLEKMALILKSSIRSCDIWARLNYNRFAALLPHTNARQAKVAIKRIDSELANTYQKNPHSPVKVKWGIAHFDKKKIKSEVEFLTKAQESIR